MIDADDPPLMLVHGENDNVVPFQLATAISERASEVSLPFEFIPIADGGHEPFERRIIDGSTVQQRGLDFLFRHLNLDELAAEYASPMTLLVPAGSTWQYQLGTSEPSPPESPLEWTKRHVDWATAVEGFGFGRDQDSRGIATVLDGMKVNQSSLYLRREFEVDETLVDTPSLFLDLDYDDGFVAYINGVEVARSNVDDQRSSPIPFDEVADISRGQSHQARHYIDMAKFSDLLTVGNNTLAIHALNRDVSNRDFYVSQIQLSAASVPEPGSAVYATWGLLVLVLRLRKTD